MEELKDESAKVTSLMVDIEATIDKVGNRMGAIEQVEEARLEAASKLETNARHLPTNPLIHL